MQILKSNNRSLSISGKGSSIRGSFSPSSFNKPLSSGGGGGSNPPITDNLSIYLNPDVDTYSDDIETPAVDGDNIRQMFDKSGNSNTLNQTTASKQPLYDTTTFGNGNAAIYAINDYFELTNNIESITTDLTMYMVYKKSTSSSIYYSLRGASGYPRFELLSTKIQIRDNQGSGRGATYVTGDVLTILAITVDRAADEFKVYVDNQLIDTASGLSTWDVTFSRIFANSTNGIYYGSFLSYQDVAHDATQVGQISDWLNTKYQTY